MRFPRADVPSTGNVAIAFRDRSRGEIGRIFMPHFEREIRQGRTISLHPGRAYAALCRPGGAAAMQHELPQWVKMSRATHFVGTAGLPQ